MGSIDKMGVKTLTAGTAEIRKKIDSKYLQFVTGQYSGLTLSTKDDAAADAGFTLENNSLTECAWVGDAAAAIVLPEAKRGDLIVFRFTGQCDGGQDITFTTATGESYEVQSINIYSPLDGLSGPGPLQVGSDIVTTQTLGDIETVVAGDNTLTIAATATNNQTNKGAEVGFYCVNDGKWFVSWKGSGLGSGAINATFEFSTV